MQAPDDRTVLAYLRDHLSDMTALLVQLVEMESPSNSKSLLDRLAVFLAEQLSAVGARVEPLVQSKAGDHVRARWDGDEGGVLLLCHMDTVWEAGTLARRPVRVDDGRLYGPGAFDMKGGIVNVLWAIRALRELNAFPNRRVTLLITSDEEIGSRTSRPMIEAEAVSHDAVFVMEPAQPPNAALKTSRKGVGVYRVSITGRSAHAGVDHEKGINAIEELAHQILAIQRFTDYAAGTTVNVGVVDGGTRSNVVPEEATARVDVRVVNAAEAERIDEKMRGLKPHLDGARIQISGGVNRPPMNRTPEIASLFGQAEVLAVGMGLHIAEAGSGGGSDGNFTAALGVPTLDGLGVVGDGGHANHEHVVLASMPERAALLAAMIRRGGRP
jgi:glutamate carboxypeptidase